jgi:glycosyltransferase involved in cell wall biosynthesis
MPLSHPPAPAEMFYGEEAEDSFFYSSRLASLKRQALVLQALAATRRQVRVRFAGSADEAHYGEELLMLARELNVEARVEWLGQVTEEEQRALYAYALGVIFPPVDEDYGYVTLEAMLAVKPLIPWTGSGAPLEFVQGDVTGLIVEPSPQAIARPSLGRPRPGTGVG